MNWKQWIPGPGKLGEYRISWLPKDLAAGITLGAVMVPVGLAFGELAGLPLAGLYAGIFPLLGYACFGSSRQLIVGPDASMAALVATSLAPLAGGDLVKLAILAGALAVLIGLICILGGLMRLGFMADFLAKPVIVGFMHGLAVVIFVGQLPKVFGFKISGETTWNQMIEIGKNIGEIHWLTFSVGAACVAVILCFRRWAPRIPGQIVALLLSLSAVYLLALDAKGVAVVGEIPQGLPKFQLPIPTWEDFRQLLPIAFAAALVAFSDTMVTARGFASRNRYRIDANQEMLALGLGNIASGFTQGLPISASGARTAVAESSGSKTQVTSVVAALVVAFVMLFLTDYLRKLPSAALGGILIAAAYSLCDTKEFLRLWKFRGVGFLGALLTMLGVVGIGVMEGIAIGVSFSLILLFYFLSFPQDSVLGEVEGSGEFHDLVRRSDAKQIPGLILYRLSAPLFFANAGRFRSRIEALIDESSGPVRAVVVDASAFFEIDLAGCETLMEMHDDFQKRGIRMSLGNVRDRIKDLLARSGALEVFGTKEIFSTLSEAVKASRL